MPAISRQRNKRLIEDYMNLQKDSDNSPFNFYKDASDKSLGIVVSGIAPELSSGAVSRRNPIPGCQNFTISHTYSTP